MANLVMQANEKPHNEDVEINVKIFKGHKGEVNCCAFSSDNRLLVTASDDAQLILWNAKKKRKLCELSGHSGPVNSCAFSPDNALLASGSYDNTVRIWKTVSALCCNVLRDESEQWICPKFDRASGSDVIHVARLRGHHGNVNTVVFSIAGLLASGSWDRSIILWNPAKAEMIKKLQGHTGWVKSVSFAANSLELVSAADDDTVRVWNVLSGKCLKLCQATCDITSGCFFSASGSLVTSGGVFVRGEDAVKRDEEDEDIVFD